MTDEPTSTALTHAPAAPLPGEHVDHAAVFYNEAAMRKQGFEIGLSAIDAEIEGKRIEREDKIAEIERNFASDMRSLERRRTMMVIGVEMAGAALAAWEKAQPVEQTTQAPQENESSD